MFLLTQLNFVYNMCYLGGGVETNDISMIEILVKNLVAVHVMAIVARGIAVYMPRGSQKHVFGRLTSYRDSLYMIQG